LPFAWTGKKGLANVGRFDLKTQGADAGVFFVHRLDAMRGSDGRFIVDVLATLDPAGAAPLAAPGGFVVTNGDAAPIPVGAPASDDRGDALLVSHAGDLVFATYDKSSRTLRMTADASLPALAAAPPGTRLPIRLKFQLRPAAGFAGQTLETVREFVSN
jgi:hypothetical protein